MSDNELELLKQGNQQTLDQMARAMPEGDPCSKKHEDLLIPFAKRTFELNEMQFSKAKGSVKLPTPWGVMELDSRDFIRLVGVILVGFVVFMNFTDKQERQQIRDEIRSYKQLHTANVAKTNP